LYVVTPAQRMGALGEVHLVWKAADVRGWRHDILGKPAVDGVPSVLLEGTEGLPTSQTVFAFSTSAV
jgi:hypothetical protein